MMDREADYDGERRLESQSPRRWRRRRSCCCHRQPEPRGVGEGSYLDASGGSHAVARGPVCMSTKRAAAAAAARKEAGRAGGAVTPMVRGSRPALRRTEESGPAIGSIAAAEIRSNG